MCFESRNSKRAYWHKLLTTKFIYHEKTITRGREIKPTAKSNDFLLEVHFLFLNWFNGVAIF